MEEQRKHTYGIAGLTQALSGINFPATKEQIIQQKGGNWFEPAKNQQMTVKDALQFCSKDQFKTMADIVTCPEVEQKITEA